MGDRCEKEISAQVNREAWKHVPEADDETSRLIHQGLSLGERHQVAREMRDALNAKAKELVAPVDVEPKDFAKFGIKVNGDIITFKNGIQYDTATHKLVDTRPGSKDGGFRIDTIYDKDPGNQDRKKVGLEIYGIAEGKGANAVENRLAAYDSIKRELYIPVKGGELIVDNRTGKMKFQPDQLVACKDLPEMTIEEVRFGKK